MSMIFDDFDAELGPEELYDRDELDALLNASWEQNKEGYLYLANPPGEAQAFIDPDDYAGEISLSDFLAKLPAEEQRKIHERAAELQRDIIPF
jgi:hypothetical protein